jgi:anti-anti-sigma factor
LDLATAPALEQALADALASIDGGGSVEVVWLDLAALRFIDVAGARAIHHCEELARARGLQFVASEASRQARFVFEVCGLTDYARPN